ncbi:MAG: hypothetical protein JNJ80_15805 [Gemmatimonadetes bacterium]|nr:hypothetical protein [Gemmatimonadota bacterium]
MTTRWQIVGMVVALTVTGSGSARSQSSKVAPKDAPATIGLTRSGEPGVALRISGTLVTGPGRTPVAGASIYVYQTDAGGAYTPTNPRDSDHPRIHGYLRTDRLGRYAFTTVRPGSYPNTTNPGHIHYQVVAPGYRDRIFEIVFAGDTLIPAQWLRDASNELAAVAVVRLERTADGGWHGVHDVVLRPDP